MDEATPLNENSDCLATARLELGELNCVLRVAVGRKLTGVVYDQIGFTEVEQLLISRANHHVADEKGVVGTGADYAHLELVFRNPAYEAVNYIQALPRVEVINGALAIDHEGVIAEGEVDRTPPDVVLRGGLLDDTLVLWASAGVLARAAHKRAGGGESSAALMLERLFVKLGHTAPRELAYTRAWPR